MTGLALHFFGYPQIRLDGTPVDMRRRKEVALLTYLAATQRAHSRDTLADLLWPGYGQTSARGNLRRTLSGLNRSLGGGWLSVDREQVALAQQDGLWIDVAAFHERLAQCESHGHSKDQVCADCLAPLQEAVALYKDDFLAGFSLVDAPEFGVWQVHQAESLRRELAEVLDGLAHCYAASGDFMSAITCARRWLELDPLHEPAQRTLMRLHVQSGDRTAAVHQYEESVQVLAAELGMQPEPKTAALYERIRSGALIAETEPQQAAEVSIQPSHNLPEQLTPFVGRNQELEQIQRRLADPHCRLLTIVGPGGIGKTRLAIEAAQQHLDEYRDGVCFVDLTAVGSPDLLAPTILHAVAPDEYGDTNARRRLYERLCDKQLLLALDNFEHLLEGVDLLPELLRSAPALTIIVTSHERLNLREEWLEPLDGLEFPAPDETGTGSTHLQDHDATRLFLDCARRVRPGWQPSQADAAAITGVCRILEGLPLGIELAAAWTRTLPLAEVSGELEHGLSILSTSLRDVPARHRSMSAVFDQSWAMLEPGERSVLRQMSVFRGGCTREAAEAVTGAGLAELTSLVDSSWLRLRTNGRYDVHELVRQYCQDKLDSEHELATGESPAEAHRRHCDYYAQSMQGTTRQVDLQVDFLRHAPPEYGNLHAAMCWAAGFPHLSVFTALMSRLWHAAESLGQDASLQIVFSEIATILESKRERSAPRNVTEDEVIEPLVRIYRALAGLSTHFGWPEKARAEIRQFDTLVDLMEPGETERFWLSSVFRVQCQLALREGDYPAAHRSGVEALARYEDEDFVSRRFIHIGQDKHIGQIYHQADILASIANANWCLGNYNEAERDWRRSIAMGDKIGERRQRAQHCGQLARLLITVGEYTEAEALAHEAVNVGESIGDNEWASIARIWLGCVRSAGRNYAAARECFLQGVDAWHRSRYHRLSVSFTLLGYVELAEGLALAARNWFEQAVREIELYDIAQSTYMPAVLLGLGWTALAEGKPTEAGEMFRKALATGKCAAWEKMEGIAGLAEVAAREDHAEYAAELLALVVAHPFTAHAQREQSKQSLAALRDRVALDVFAHRVDAGAHRSLDVTIAELLD